MTYTIQQIEKMFDDTKQIHEDTFKETEKNIDLNGMVLKEALKNQVDLQFQWEVITKKLSKLYDICELEAETAYAEAISAELKDRFKSYSISEAREFAKANKTYIQFKRLLIEIKEVRDEARGVLSTVESRKYILNNITNGLVASVDKTIL